MKLYKLRAKVDLEDCTDRLTAFQILDDDEIGRPDPRHPALGRRFVAAPEDLASMLGGAPEFAPLEAWHRKRIGLGIPEAPYDFDYGNTFPHDIALDSRRLLIHL